jgi:general secretion pathway protein D
VKNRPLSLFIILILLYIPFYGVFADENNKIKMNFNDVEVLSFIRIIGKETGRTFVFNADILKGKRITLISDQEFTSREAYKIFESVLNVNDLTTIDEGKVTRIIASKEAKITPAPIYSADGQANDGSYITRVIPVSNIRIRAIRSNLAPLVSKDAILVGSDEANVLILRDTRENTERFAEIVGIIDRTDNIVASLNLELVKLEYAKATETAALINKIFATSDKQGLSEESKLNVLADERTNNLILIGHPISLHKIKTLIERLDHRIETDGGNIRVYRLKNANSKTIAEVLQKIATTLKTVKPDKAAAAAAGQATIIPDIPSNSLVIFADQTDFPTLENVIAQLDTPRAQVFIQALIMEVRLDKSLDFGINWQYSDMMTVRGKETVGTVGGVGSTGTPSTLSSIAGQSGSSGAVLGVVGGPFTFAGQEFSSFNAFVRAIEQDTEVDILSNPQILTLNNEEAEIKVGEIIPTVGGTTVDSTGRTTTNIEYKEVGVSLKITPQVNTDDSIELQIDETSSNVIEGKIGAFDQGAITTLNRSLKTKVVVENGQTIVLGGLINDEFSDVTIKTPCLGDIPILGWLFKTTDTGSRKTNLLIFLTPTVVRSPEDLSQVTDDAKSRSSRARQGRFRIDVSKEFGIDQEGLSDSDRIELQLEREEASSPPDDEETSTLPIEDSAEDDNQSDSSDAALSVDDPAGMSIANPTSASGLGLNAAEETTNDATTDSPRLPTSSSDE